MLGFCNFKSIKKENKENLEDFILILKQIQDANTMKTKGRGSFFGTYKERQTLIDNLVSLAIERTQEKIMELDQK